MTSGRTSSTSTACIITSRSGGILPASRADVPIVWTLHDYRTVCPVAALLQTATLCASGAAGDATGTAGPPLQFRTAHAKRRRRSGVVLARLRGTLGGDRLLRDAEPLPWSEGPWDGSSRATHGNGAESRPRGRCGRPRTARRTASSMSVGSRRKRASTCSIALLRDEGAWSASCRGWSGARGARGVGRSGWSPCAVRGLGPPRRRSRLHDSASLLCVPSVWYENCPGVVLEAMSIGLPVVASDIGGLAELLDDGRAGWLAPAADAGAWRGIIAEALADDVRTTQASCARAHASTRPSRPAGSSSESSASTSRWPGSAAERTRTGALAHAAAASHPDASCS